MRINIKIILALVVLAINLTLLTMYISVFYGTSEDLKDNLRTFERFTGKPMAGSIDMCVDWFMNLSRVEKQTAYFDEVYRLDINVTSEDIYYPNLNFSVNDTILFEINRTTGKIEFTPNSSYEGNYTFNITVGNYACTNPDDSMLLEFVIRTPNFAPILNMTNQTNLTEDVFFYLNVSANASDPNGDALSFYDNTSKFVIAENTGIIAFTPGDNDVGNWTVRIFVIDPYLALDFQDIIFSVRNVNDVPNLSHIGAQTAYLNTTFSLQLAAYDPDPDEKLNFSSNISWFLNSSGELSTSGSWAYHTLNLNFTDYATWFNTTHSINVTVQDLNGSQDSEIISLTILTVNNPPNITSYSPLQKQISLSATDCQNFNITKDDPDGTIPSTEWYIDDVFTGTTSDEYTYCGGSAGIFNITVVITDGEYNDSESWILTFTEPAAQTRTVSGGLSPSVSRWICEELWICTDWTPCPADEVQERKCKDIHGCGTLKNKPEEIWNCTYVVVPSCFDGVKNQNEILADCGGVCDPCPTCDDGIQNQGELGVDCGGVCPVCKEVMAPVKIEEFKTRDLFFKPQLYLLFWLAVSLLLLTTIRLRREIKTKVVSSIVNWLAVTFHVMKVNKLLKQAYKEADANNKKKAQDIYNKAKKLYLKLPKDKKAKVEIRRK